MIRIIADAILDEEGKPLPIWRGDKDPFDKFDRSKTRENGFFFTPDKDVAKSYTGRKDVNPLQYDINSPKVLNLFDDTPKARKFINEWAKTFDDPESTYDGWLNRETGEPEDPCEAVFGGRLFDWEGDWSSARWRDLQATAELAGYDAVILPDWGEKGLFPSYVVFHPDNIKKIAMPVVTLIHDGGLDSKGQVDLYLERFKVTKPQFLQEPEDDDYVFRPRGWIGTERNWQAWQQYVQFATRLLTSAFGSFSADETKRSVSTGPISAPQEAAARKVAKMFMRLHQQVLSSQASDVTTALT